MLRGVGPNVVFLFRNLQYLNKTTISDLRLATKNTTWIALPHVCGGGRPQLVGTFDQLEFRPIANDTCFDRDPSLSYLVERFDLLRSLLESRVFPEDDERQTMDSCDDWSAYFHPKNGHLPNVEGKQPLHLLESRVY